MRERRRPDMYTAIIVDDEKMIKKSIAALVDSHDTGFKIIGEAKDGIEALQLNEKYVPDLIITDIRMPKLNGLDFIEKVKVSNAHSKLLIISGYDEFEYAQSALRFGVVDFLLKPLKPEQFLSSLEKVYLQLEAEHNSSKKRSEWLWVLKSFSETLVQKLWLLEEADVQELIEDMHSRISDKYQEDWNAKELYVDLFLYIQGGLKKEVEGWEDKSFFNEAYLPENLPEMKDCLYDNSQAVMEHIRKTRNLGQRTNILTAVKYIRANYSEETLSLQEVADTVQMSPSYFSMEFKAEMGISFKQYITKMRLDQAKEMLNNPSYKTYEIAYNIGYSDYPHFTKTFKKHVGITPTQYRKRIGIQK